jgi:secretory carrier-associated membrane protein
MAENEQTPALQVTIRWHRYNYPPLLKLIHFSPSEIPRHKKFIVMSLFIIHLVVFGNSLLNFIASCFQGGLRVLYAFLFLLFINPVMLFLFQKGSFSPI